MRYANDRVPDNSQLIAARKPAWVRVYLRPGLFVTQWDKTGRLTLDKKTNVIPEVWTLVADHAPASPGHAFVDATIDYATERSTLGATLNFVLPADQVRGYLRLTVAIWPVGASVAAASDQETIYVDATMLQTLRVRGILVSYNGPSASGDGPNLNLAAPTLADLQATSAQALTVFPVESTGVFSTGGSPPPQRAC